MPLQKEIGRKACGTEGGVSGEKRDGRAFLRLLEGSGRKEGDASGSGSIERALETRPAIWGGCRYGSGGESATKKFQKMLFARAAECGPARGLLGEKSFCRYLGRMGAVLYVSGYRHTDDSLADEMLGAICKEYRIMVEMGIGRHLIGTRGFAFSKKRLEGLKTELDSLPEKGIARGMLLESVMHGRYGTIAEALGGYRIIEVEAAGILKEAGEPHNISRTIASAVFIKARISAEDAYGVYTRAQARAGKLIEKAIGRKAAVNTIAHRAVFSGDGIADKFCIRFVGDYQKALWLLPEEITSREDAAAHIAGRMLKHGFPSAEKACEIYLSALMGSRELLKAEGLGQEYAEKMAIAVLSKQQASPEGALERLKSRLDKEAQVNVERCLGSMELPALDGLGAEKAIMRIYPLLVAVGKRFSDSGIGGDEAFLVASLAAYELIMAGNRNPTAVLGVAIGEAIRQASSENSLQLRRVPFKMALGHEEAVVEPDFTDVY